VVTAGVFAVVKLVPEANAVYGIGLGAIQAALWILIGIFTGQPIGEVVPVSLVMDASDLMALPAVGIAYLVGAGRLGAARAAGTGR
jgi:hypothetical protein